MTYEILLRGGGSVPEIVTNLTPLQLENQIKEWQGLNQYVRFISDTDRVVMIESSEIVGFAYMETAKTAAVLGGATS
jgi:hypothetical protein